MDCIFCDIISKQSPAHILFEDEFSIAFLDIHPSSPGHTCIVTRHHYETLLDVPLYELKPLMISVQKIIKALEKTFTTSMLTVGINHGELAGVRHLHIHAIPRYQKDGGKIIQSLVYNKGVEPLSEVARKIKEHI